MPRPNDEAARSAAADSACLGSGSTTRHRFTACIGRLSAAVGTGRARCLWKAVAVCWADALHTTASEADRALRPMLPTSAWDPWPFCVCLDTRWVARRVEGIFDLDKLRKWIMNLQHVT